MNISTSLTLITRRLFSFAPAVIIAICLIGLGIYVDRQNIQSSEQALRHSIINQLSVVRAKLEGNINSNAQSVKGLVAAISIEPDMSEERFTALSKPLFKGSLQLRNIAAAPDLVIRYMYPVQGNEAAIGLDFRDIQGQLVTVKKAIDMGELILAGPLKLVQGGQGLIARFPVFVADNKQQNGRLWGIVSAVIDVDKFYRESNLHDLEQDLHIAIRGLDGLAEKGGVFYGQENIFTLSPVIVDITLPHGSWQLAAIPKRGWSIVSDHVRNFRIAMIVVGLLILIPLVILGIYVQKKRGSEALLRGLFELSPVGIALNDYATGSFVNMNDALLKPTGYTREEFLKLSYWDITPKIYEAQEALQLESLEKTGRYGPYEKEYINKDGNHYPVLLSGVVIYDALGNKKIWSIVEDISERVKIQNDLIIARDQANRANQAKSDFLSSMSHELRTPLNAIVGFGQLLELSDLSESDKESVAHIVKAGRHLADMINEILDIARIESGRYELSPEPILVRDMLLETWGLLQPLADRKNIKLLQEIPKSCRDSVFVDRQRLKQVFLNLMSNAIKYNNENGHVSLFCSAQPEGIIRISIKDTGPGIEADNLARVFEPFVRLDDDTANTEGSGIGLSLSKVLVEAMGGNLGVDSEPGVGSTFWIEIPLFQDTTGIEAAPEADTVHESTLEIEQLNTTTILYIEDDRVNIKLVEAILGEQEGVELMTATEGEQGYDLAVKLLPDLILLDSQLPDIPGYDVLNKLKSHPGTRAIPVIVISADATEKQIEKLKSAGAYAYLTKPFNINELLQTVETAAG